MSKKISWLILIILVIASGLYLKFLYPGSQLQLKKSFRFVEAMPIEHYYNASEKTCGIYYEKQGGNSNFGKDNEKVLACFKKAFADCTGRNILLVSDQGEAQAGKIVYSLIKILRRNDQNKCIIQHFYEEQDLAITENEIPISFINTCTVLSKDLFSSCEPLFIKERKIINQQIKLDLLIQDQLYDEQ